jgi:hypothetical protein
MLHDLTIISGGQTGADRAALDFAIENEISCGGFCPHSRKAEDGTIPSRYPLTPINSDSYEDRTKANVKEADGTLVFLWQKPAGEGTQKTIDFCQKYHKPYYLCEIEKLTEISNYCHIPQWLIRHQIKTINVAGNRESENPGIYQKTYQALNLLLHL